MKYNILTGVRATGYLHLGNYVGAIKPLMEQRHQLPHSTPLLLIADYHSLTCLKDPLLRQRYRRHIAAALLSMDIPQARVLLQSSIPELMELHWIFSSYITLGTIKRCHTYKASADKNSMNLALFSYPVLMAADILGLEADIVTVGQDQAQHLEIARSLARTMELKIPQVELQQAPNLVGTDGRKMSKSYANTLPIFASPEETYKIIMGIPTSSQGIHEPKDSSTCTIFALYRALASPTQIADLQNCYERGISWKEAKERLYDLFLQEFKEIRARYAHYVDNTLLLEDKLAQDTQLIRENTHFLLKRIKQKRGM